MQDYSQPGGVSYPPPLQPPYGGSQTQPQSQTVYSYQAPKPSKKGKWLKILGIIGLIVGICGALGTAMFFTMDTNVKSISELSDDYVNGNFKSYDTNDFVNVKGKITDKDDARAVWGVSTSSGGYVYQLDYEQNEYLYIFSTDDDLGDVGDDIKVRCMIKERPDITGEVEYLHEFSSVEEATSSICLTFAVIVIIVSVVLIVVGIKLDKKAKSVPPPPSYLSYPPPR